MRRAAFNLLAILGLMMSPVSGSAAGGGLEALAQHTREARAADAAVTADRLQRFERERDLQVQRLAEARQARDAAQARSAALLQQFEENEARIVDQQTQLESRSGYLGEVFGVVRQTAGDLSAQAMNGLATLQAPERQARFETLATATSLPSAEQLEQLWLDLLDDIAASGQVSRFEAPVIDVRGERRTVPVTAAGPFVAVAEGRYLVREPDADAFVALGAQPGRRIRRLAAALESAEEASLVRVAIDPSRGALLGVLVQTPGVVDRVRTAGWVGVVILLLGVAGALLALERFIVLSRLSRSVHGQRRQLETPQPGNPLGRVLQVHHAQPGLDPETLELKLDDAVLREIPALETRIGWLKIIAAVAPLLGLLGTVTGMILTFQQITLFGTGDPKLMAGGISQALMTTVLGLIVAIPMVLLHAALNARSRALIQVLEEESAGLVAERAERRGFAPGGEVAGV